MNWQLRPSVLVGAQLLCCDRRSRQPLRDGILARVTLVTAERAPLFGPWSASTVPVALCQGFSAFRVCSSLAAVNRPVTTKCTRFKVKLGTVGTERPVVWSFSRE